MTRPSCIGPCVSRVFRSEGMEVVVEANEAERMALAVRMGLPAIHALRSRFVLTRQGDGIVEAVGRLEAAVVQTCVVSLEDFELPLAEDFMVNFVPEGTESDDPDPELVDEIPYGGDTIDVGEATSEQLSLSLDPYPRRPDATLPETESATDPRLAVLSAWREAKGRQ